MLHVRGAVTGALGGCGRGLGNVCKKVLKRSEAAIYLHLHLTSLAVCQKGVKCQAAAQARVLSSALAATATAAPLLMAAAT